jgi:phage FluMu gp28-like protein
VARPSPIVLTPPTLHTGQTRIYRDPARHRVVACGRRWGKTRVGTYIATRRFLDGGRVWWIAPTYQMALLGWREIRYFIAQVPRATIAESSRSASFGRGLLTVRSSDDPNSLRGEGLDLAIFDEAAFHDESAWTHAIRPALADRKGRALFLSTPNGRNWFHTLYQNAIADDTGEWSAHTEPTVNNPFIAPEEIESARKSLPERVYQQEFLAAFIEDGGSVFRGIRESTTARALRSAEVGHRYTVGVDWGKLDDFTVITVLDDATGEVVHVDRFNQIDYTIQKGRVVATCERFRPGTVVVERNSMGEPLIEDLIRAGLPVQPFQTTNASKRLIIDALTLAFERREIRIPNDAILIAELEAFSIERLPGGSLRFSAQPGAHDDMVMSLAFAWHGSRGAAPGAHAGFLKMIRRDLEKEQEVAA